MEKYRVNGNLPKMVIEARSEDEAIEIYLDLTKYNEIKVEKLEVEK